MFWGLLREYIYRVMLIQYTIYTPLKAPALYFYHVKIMFRGLCFHCTGNIFPFNHFVDDDEFKFALFTFDNTIEYNDFLNL